MIYLSVVSVCRYHRSRVDIGSTKISVTILVWCHSSVTRVKYLMISLIAMTSPCCHTQPNLPQNDRSDVRKTRAVGSEPPRWTSSVVLQHDTFSLSHQLPPSKISWWDKGIIFSLPLILQTRWPPPWICHLPQQARLVYNPHSGWSWGGHGATTAPHTGRTVSVHVWG
jgi:hypothetical protein